MSVEIVEKDLSYRVVGVAMEVHRKLGPGLDEFFYHKAMLEKFQATEIHGRYKCKGKLTHKAEFADGFETDFVIENSTILELKRLDGSFCPEHYAQIISYLKHWNIRLGMLIDFGKESLIYERVVYTSPEISLDPNRLCERQPEDLEGRNLFTTICRSLVDVAHQYGLGYRDTTYRALVRIDLQSFGLEVSSPTATIRIDDQVLGNANLKCFVINNTCVLCVLALQDKLRAADRAIVQTYLNHLNLHWGLLVNFGKQEFEARYIWLG